MKLLTAPKRKAPLELHWTKLQIMNKLTVKLKDLSYPVFYEKGLLQGNFIADYCKSIGRQIVVITHKNILNLFAKPLFEKFKKENLNVKLVSFKEGEENKTRKTKEDIEDQMLKSNFGKDTLIIAVGGGIVSDLCGFIASTYMRGIPYVIVPTTLLAMADASIGGKTAVNTPLGKNLIGTIYQPKAVFIDFDVLKTLCEREMKNGVCEMLKHALILKKQAFYRLLKAKEITPKLIMESIKIKKRIVEADEKERDLRKILNFGHTVAHAIEASLDYKISHGQALAWGILAESRLSYSLKYLSKKHFDEIHEFLKIKKLLENSRDFSIGKIMKFIMRDKKNVLGKNRFVLLKGIGKSIKNVGIIKNLVVNSLGFCLEDKYASRGNHRT